jgi:hypothetical protein
LALAVLEAAVLQVQELLTQAAAVALKTTVAVQG